MIEPRVNQMQVQTRDRSHASPTGVRALMRQDPDIIMVGEIRDHETADMAIQAALTGHLVLSTLHTNDAPIVDHAAAGPGRAAPTCINSSAHRRHGAAPGAHALPAIAARRCPSSARRSTSSGTRCCAPFKAPAARARLPAGRMPRVPQHRLSRPHRHLRDHAGHARDQEVHHRPTRTSHALTQAAYKAGMRPLRVSGATKVAQGITTFEEVLKSRSAARERRLLRRCLLVLAALAGAAGGSGSRGRCRRSTATVTAKGLARVRRGAARQGGHPAHLRRRASATAGSRWATCTRRTACGRWSSSGASRRGGSRNSSASALTTRDRLMRTLGIAHVADRIVARLGSGHAREHAGLCRGRQRLPRFGPMLPIEFQVVRREAASLEARRHAWAGCGVMAWDLSTNFRIGARAPSLRREARARARRTRSCRPTRATSRRRCPISPAVCRLAPAARMRFSRPTRRKTMRSAPTTGSSSGREARPASRCSPTIRTSACRRPSLWYLVHLSTPSGNVVGGTLPGVPFVVLGHNDNIAWGFDDHDQATRRTSSSSAWRRAIPASYVTPKGNAKFEMRDE